MEHRWSVRTPLSTQVTIYHNKLPVAVCTTKDIGLGGLFINSGPITYPVNTTLDLEFKLDSGEEFKQYRMLACVVYGSEKGLGLMFLEPNPEVIRTVRKMILDNAHNHTQDIQSPEVATTKIPVYNTDIEPLAVTL